MNSSPAPSSHGAGSAPLPYAWATVALLWPVAVLNYLDRQMLATMGVSIKADIAEVRQAENFGHLMGIFMWVYAFSSPFGGWIADRLNRKWLIVASLAIWSVVTLLMGSAETFRQLFVLRGVMGLSEAFYIPAGLALIADYHRGPTRSSAIGLHLSGVYMGQALGGIGGWVAQDISWRAAFAGCGWIGVAYALVLTGALREIRHEAPVPRDTATSKPFQSVHWVGFAILLICFTLPSFPGWAMKNWLPTLLQDSFHLEQKPAGLWATLTNAGAAFIGVVVGGRLSDRWVRLSPRGRTWVSGLGLVLTIPALAGVGLSPNFWVAAGCIALFGFGFGVFDANNMPILCQVVAPRFRATAYGVMNFAGISAGALLTPYLGRLKDHGVPLYQGFALCAVPAAVAAILMFALRPTVRDRTPTS